mmetsp:Transcript_59967/g.99535  ORF Transcript_59967/g.99535 Transcript_59967/m.99535 type:complete len:289 (+) Transcript_59967:1974-2840(+)
MAIPAAAKLTAVLISAVIAAAVLAEAGIVLAVVLAGVTCIWLEAGHAHGTVIEERTGAVAEKARQEAKLEAKQEAKVGLVEVVEVGLAAQQLSEGTAARLVAEAQVAATVKATRAVTAVALVGGAPTVAMAVVMAAAVMAVVVAVRVAWEEKEAMAVCLCPLCTHSKCQTCRRPATYIAHSELDPPQSTGNPGLRYATWSRCHFDSIGTDCLYLGDCNTAAVAAKVEASVERAVMAVADVEVEMVVASAVMGTVGALVTVGGVEALACHWFRPHSCSKMYGDFQRMRI